MLKRPKLFCAFFLAVQRLPGRPNFRRISSSDDEATRQLAPTRQPAAGRPPSTLITTARSKRSHDPLRGLSTGVEQRERFNTFCAVAPRWPTRGTPRQGQGPGPARRGKWVVFHILATAQTTPRGIPESMNLSFAINWALPARPTSCTLLALHTPFRARSFPSWVLGAQLAWLLVTIFFGQERRGRACGGRELGQGTQAV